MNTRIKVMGLAVLASWWAASACQAGAPVILGGYMALHRDGPERVVLAEGGGEFATDRANFGFQSGFWTVLGWRVSDGLMFDTSFMGVPRWTERANAFTDGVTPVTSQFLNINGAAVSAVRFNYVSDLMGADLNVRGILGSEDSVWVSFFGGFKFFSFQEDFDFAGLRTGTETTPGAVELTRVRTSNRMYGGQFGGDINAAIGGWLGMTGYAKGGILANDAEANVGNALLTDGSEAAGRLGFQVRDTIPAYFLESGVQFLVRFSDHIELKGGYRVLFLTGLALAPEQLSANSALFGRTIQSDSTSSFSDVGVLNRDGNVFFHGPFLGLELHW